MSSVKVLETTYNGVTYRSRTEARWAVFFDRLGLIADYEMEGYDIGGEWYLPDFRVPELNAFFEIKGVEPNYVERKKARKLAIDTQSKIIILVGTPSPVATKNMLFIPPKTHQEWNDAVDCKNTPWGWYLGNLTDNAAGEVYFERLKNGVHLLGHRGSDVSVIDAMNAARNERFGVHD